MIFSNTEYFYLIFFVPVIIFLLVLRLQKKKKILLQIYSKQFIQRFKLFHANVAKTVVLSLFVSLLCLYFFDPHIQLQESQGAEETKPSVLHIFIDVSRSMYIKDTNKTRIAHAVELLQRSLAKQKNVFITVSVFTDTVLQLMPKSNDKIFLHNAFEEIKKGPLITGSSDLLPVFTQLSQENFRYHRADQDASIIILSDWELHREVNFASFTRLSLLYPKMYFVVIGTDLKTIVFDEEGSLLRDANDKTVFSRANKDLARDYAKRLGANLLVHEEQRNQIIDIQAQNKMYSSLAWLICLVLASLLLVYIILER